MVNWQRGVMRLFRVTNHEVDVTGVEDFTPTYRRIHFSGPELLAQLDETFNNFDALIGAARARQPALPAKFGSGTRLKVYVRDRNDLPAVADALDRRLGDTVPRVLLHAAICRSELAVEIDGVHG